MSPPSASCSRSRSWEALRKLLTIRNRKEGQRTSHPVFLQASLLGLRDSVSVFSKQNSISILPNSEAEYTPCCLFVSRRGGGEGAQHCRALWQTFPTQKHPAMWAQPHGALGTASTQPPGHSAHILMLQVLRSPPLSTQPPAEQGQGAAEA